MYEPFWACMPPPQPADRVRSHGAIGDVLAEAIELSPIEVFPP